MTAGRSASFAVLKPGMLTTVQDLGRFGYQGVGVPVSGPMDAYSHALANDLIGNDPRAAALEITLIGPELLAEGDLACVVTGADIDVFVDAIAVARNQVFEVPSGSRLRFGARRRGARAALAVRGGFDVPATLGSRATHLASGMGPFGGRALKAGDALPVGAESAKGAKGAKGDKGAKGAEGAKGAKGAEGAKGAKGAEGAKGAKGAEGAKGVEGAKGAEGAEGANGAGADGAGALRALELPDGGARLRVLPAVHRERFTDAAWQQLTHGRYMITPQSNRMGYRLEGATLTHIGPADILSEAMPIGALQVPASGQPILLLAECATTGGYATIANVVTADLPIAGQLAPGDWIEFVPCTRDEALSALRARRTALGLRHATAGEASRG